MISMASKLKLNILAFLSFAFIAGVSLCLSYSPNNSRYLLFRKNVLYSKIAQTIIYAKAIGLLICNGVSRSKLRK